MEQMVRLSISIGDRSYCLYARPDLDPVIQEAAGQIQQQIGQLREAGHNRMIEMLTMVALEQTSQNLSKA